MYSILQLACVASFWLKVPMLLAVRVRSGAPWWFVIVAATALGWILSNASVYLQHLVVDEAGRQDAICATQAAIVPPATQAAVENSCGTGDHGSGRYKPLAGLIYGPLYLLCASLPYWLIFGRRSSSGMTRPIALLAGAALVLEWAAIVGDCIRPGYWSGMCTRADPYIWPPLSIAAAFVVGWFVTTQVLQRFARRRF